MELTSALPILWTEVGPLFRRRINLTRIWPMAASIVLHGLCLLTLVNWNRTEGIAPQIVEAALVVQVVQPPVPEVAVASASQQPPPLPVPQQPPTKRASIRRLTGTSAIVPSPNITAVPVVSEEKGTGDSAAGSGTGIAGENTAGRNEGMSGMTSDSTATPAEGNPLPVYPVAARRAGREGRVVLLVRIKISGECAEAEIAESSGTSSLDEAAKAAVGHWRFLPATQSGQKVETTLRVPVSFRLSGVSS